MRKLSLLIFIITVGIIFFVYKKNSGRHAGICLSFDDRYINEWFQLRDVFIKNNVKVTFFITQPDSLNNDEIAKLKILQKDGHEIGYHGNMHVISSNYIKENSYAEYIDKEIDCGMNTMKSLGFNCVSFAYPYGAKYWFTDFLLSRKFEYLRGVSPLNEEKDLTQIDDIYYSFNNDKTINALGLDNNSGITKIMLDNAIQRAINKKEVLMLYAHLPTTDNHKIGYAFNVDLLHHIIQLANEKNIGFYPICELQNYLK